MIANFLKKRWQRLSIQSGSKRLSLFTLILLFGLDIYILGLIFDGMKNAARIIEPPYLSISRGCQLMSESFLQFDPKDRVESFERYIPVNDESQDDPMSDDWYGGRRPLAICTQMRQQVYLVAKNRDLIALFRARSQQQQQIQKIRSNIDELKATYSDALLEKLAIRYVSSWPRLRRCWSITSSFKPLPRSFKNSPSTANSSAPETDMKN